MKITKLLAVCILLGATAQMKAQSAPEDDFDAKYATELVKQAHQPPTLR